MSETKRNVIDQTKNAVEKMRAEIDKNRSARRQKRQEKWAARFPFNIIGEMLRGVTGEPRR